MSEGLPLEARDNIARYPAVGRTTVELARLSSRPLKRSQKSTAIWWSEWTGAEKSSALSAGPRCSSRAKELETTPSKLPTGPFQVIVANPPWECASRFATVSALP